MNLEYDVSIQPNFMVISYWLDDHQVEATLALIYGGI
jgi:hypothetical protein